MLNVALALVESPQVGDVRVECVAAVVGGMASVVVGVNA
jgi:hypothetical protein